MATIAQLDTSVNRSALVADLVRRGQDAAKASRFDEACETFAQALALEPESPNVLINYGAALADGKRWDAGFEFTTRALELAVTDQQRAICLNNLGHLAHIRREFGEAERLLRRSLKHDPEYKAPLISLGANLVLQGRWPEASALFDEASLLFAGDWEPMMNRAICRLTMGDWRLGLPGYEQRKLMNDAVKFEQAAKAVRWKGESLAGQAIAIWPDQGLGDCVYTHRLVGEVAKRAGHVYFMTYVPLHDVLPVFPNVTVLREGDKADCIHYQAPAMSLMYGLRVDPEHPPEPTGLVTRKKFDVDGSKINVGICWSGNPSHRYDDLRSVPLADLLLGLGPVGEGVSFHGLQKDIRPHDEAAVAGAIQRHDIKTVADLAALCSRMDIVVTVDTLTLHVAGELGKPTIAMLPFSPDFRWLLDRPDCPWYPSVTLLRHCTPVGGWSECLTRVKRMLDKRISSLRARE